MDGNVSIKIEDDVVEVVRGHVKDPWPGRNEEIFIDIMEEEVKLLGSRATGTFQKESWPRMRKALIDKTKYQYNDTQIKNKFNSLRQLHTQFSAICNQTGVGWCAETGTIIAAEEHWERLTKVHKKAKKFRKHGFKHYAAMSRILGDTTATGYNLHPSTHSPSGTDSSDTPYEIKQEEDDEVEVSEVSGKGKKKAFDMKSLKITKPKKSSKSRKRSSFTADLQASLSTLADSSKRKADILEAKHIAKSSSLTESSGDQGYSEPLLMECQEVLNNMKDLDGAWYAKGLKVLKEDPSWRGLFLNMTDNRRKDWIASFL